MVAQPEDELLALGQVQDGVGDALPQLCADDAHGRVGGARIGQRLEQGCLGAVGSADVPRMIEGDHARVGHALQRGVELVRVYRHLGGQLGISRRSMQAGRELHRGPLDLARLAANAARHPVQRAELVEDRAADPRAGIGLELDPARRVEALHRLDEPTETVRDEVRDLDMRGHASHDAAGQVLDHRRVREDQLVA